MVTCHWSRRVHAKRDDFGRSRSRSIASSTSSGGTTARNARLSPTATFPLSACGRADDPALGETLHGPTGNERNRVPLRSWELVEAHPQDVEQGDRRELADALAVAGQAGGDRL